MLGFNLINLLGATHTSIINSFYSLILIMPYLFKGISHFSAKTCHGAFTEFYIHQMIPVAHPYYHTTLVSAPLPPTDKETSIANPRIFLL